MVTNVEKMGAKTLGEVIDAIVDVSNVDCENSDDVIKVFNEKLNIVLGGFDAIAEKVKKAGNESAAVLPFKCFSVLDENMRQRAMFILASCYRNSITEEEKKKEATKREEVLKKSLREYIDATCVLPNCKIYF